MRKFTLFICTVIGLKGWSQVDVVTKYSRVIVRLGDNPGKNQEYISQVLKNKAAVKSKQVFLYCDQLKTIPTEFFKLKKIEDLYIYGDSLTEIPGDLNELSSLKTLTFGPTKISSFAKPLKLPSLEKFDLYSSNLNTFPEGIFESGKLRFLSVNRSMITAIPDEILNLKKLEHFSVMDNDISKLPSALFKCTSIKVLIAEANQLTELPDDIGNLKELAELDVLINPIQTYSRKILELEKLNYFFQGAHPQAIQAFGITTGIMDNYALTWKRCSMALKGVYGDNKKLGKPGGVYYMLFMGFSPEKVQTTAKLENINITRTQISANEQSALVLSGTGKALTVDDIWEGKLTPGAVIGLSGKGNKPAIFLGYIYKEGKITGLRYWEEGDSREDGKLNYETYKDVHSTEFLNLEFPNEVIRGANYK